MSLIHDTSNAIQALRMLDSFGLAAFICDASGIIQLLNSSAGALFRQEPNSLEGQTLSEVEAFAPLAGMLASETPQIDPQLFMFYDQLHCLVRMQRIGRVGYVFTFEDVTEFKQREQEHTIAIDNVAHDLKTPISAIRGFADLVKSGGELSDVQQKFLERIYLSLNNMEALVGDLLDIALLDSDKEIKFEQVNLDTLLEQAITNLQMQATKRKIDVKTEIQDGLAPFRGDSRRLERAITNLLNNAIKYTPIGGTVTLKLTSDGQYHILEVADTGIGIPEDYLPHIFKRFYRVPRHDEELSKIDGTGLGLSIVKSVVDLHQGDINVVSKVDEGSVFTMRLPLSD